jgi:arylsulfatase A-like enzyme
VFNAMSRHAIVGERHYTTAPTTRLAIDSLIGGVYPQSGTARAQAGGFSTNGLAQVLRTHGYETSFFDPYYIDWDGPEDARMVRDLGFTTVEDRQQLTVPSEPYEKSFAARLRQHEARAFAATLDAIATASSHHRKAFVCLVTHLGHFDWLADDDRLSAPERIALIARQIDGLMGGLLTGLGARGLSDDVVIVAVGDHGLRFDVEFQALGQAPRYGDVTFQVPLLVYAPALLPAEVRVPYATSHIDIAPTLLYLVGISSDGLYLGDNILDRRLADRVTFLLSGTYPGLHPVDGFAWKDRVYASYRILNRVTVRHAGQADERPIESDPASPFTASAVRSLIDTGIGLFDEAADCFRWRWTKAPTNGHTAPR